MASFSGRFQTIFNIPTSPACSCNKLLTSIGPPPQFLLKSPPELDNDLMPTFDITTTLKCNYNLTSNSMIHISQDEPLVIAKSLLFVILFVIVALSLFLIFFILIIFTIVRHNRNKLAKTKKEQNFVDHRYNFSNSSSIDKNCTSLMQFDPIQNNNKQFNSEMSSNLSSNSTTSSSASPNSNLNSSFVNEMEFVSQTNSKSTFKLTNASTSTSSSFLSESHSFLTNNSQHMLLPSRNHFQKQQISSDSSNQHQYESITDLESQYYFDVDDPNLKYNFMESRQNQILSPDKYLATQPHCQCTSQHSADCFLSIQQQINTFNRINNINNSQDNYLNSLIV